MLGAVIDCFFAFSFIYLKYFLHPENNKIELKGNIVNQAISCCNTFEGKIHECEGNTLQLPSR